MAVRRDEKSLLPPVMLSKLESVLTDRGIGARARGRARWPCRDFHPCRERLARERFSDALVPPSGRRDPRWRGRRANWGASEPVAAVASLVGAKVPRRVAPM